MGKRKVNRRTFAQIRIERDAEIAGYMDSHADCLGDREAATIVRALASNIRGQLHADDPTVPAAAHQEPKP